MTDMERGKSAIVHKIVKNIFAADLFGFIWSNKLQNDDENKMKWNVSKF